MTSENDAQKSAVAADAARDTWATPEIVSFDMVEATKANTVHLGDMINSLS